MTRGARDEDRERRIDMEIIVDCYESEEQAAGWHVYLEEHLQFPFTARCTQIQLSSPLEVGDEVEAIGMAPEEECDHDMLVQIRWGRRPLAVPLLQLEGVAVDEETREAVADWRYWNDQGYEL
jgi:hypothetical protein